MVLKETTYIEATSAQKRAAADTQEQELGSVARLLRSQRRQHSPQLFTGIVKRWILFSSLLSEIWLLRGAPTTPDTKVQSSYEGNTSEVWLSIPYVSQRSGGWICNATAGRVCHVVLGEDVDTIIFGYDMSFHMSVLCSSVLNIIAHHSFVATRSPCSFCGDHPDAEPIFKSEATFINAIQLKNNSRKIRLLIWSV